MEATNELFNNILRYAEDHHCLDCPCGLNPTQIHEAPPPSSEASKNISDAGKILLLNDISDTSQIQKNHLRNHFTILAQKYHPDKNARNMTPRCTETMQILNTAFSVILQQICFQEDKPCQLVREDRIYTKVNDYTITCQFLDCFSIYGSKDHVKSWTTKLNQYWTSRPRIINKKSTKNTIQYGDTNESLYITVFQNGTIQVQGVMAIAFSTSTSAKWIQEVAKEKYDTNAKNFSQNLKRELALFTSQRKERAIKASTTPPRNNEQRSAPSIASSTSLPNASLKSARSELVDSNDTLTMSKNNEHNTTMNYSTDEITKLKEELTTAMAIIQGLQAEMKQLKSDNNSLKQEIKQINTENKQIMSTLGPRLGNTEKKSFQQYLMLLCGIEHKPPIPLKQIVLVDQKTMTIQTVNQQYHNLDHQTLLPLMPKNA